MTDEDKPLLSPEEEARVAAREKMADAVTRAKGGTDAAASEAAGMARDETQRSIFRERRRH